MTQEELKGVMKQIGVAEWRGRDLFRWIFARGATNWEGLTTFSSVIRHQLPNYLSFDPLHIEAHHKSLDGTQKWVLNKPQSLFNLSCSQTPVGFEAVFIPEVSRGTACLSSQVGCSLSCLFCHTGTMSKKNLRNLSTAEIVGQLMGMKHELSDFPLSGDKKILSNIVMMGMGEPLYNFKNVSKAIQILTDPDGLAFSKRKVTISTSGVVPLIEKIGSELGVCLAVSLHAVNDELRDTLVPINKTYPLKELISSIKKYVEAINQKEKVTIEYVMLKGVNDSITDAKELIRLLHGIPCFVNLIPVKFFLFFSFSFSFSF